MITVNYAENEQRRRAISAEENFRDTLKDTSNGRARSRRYNGKRDNGLSARDALMLHRRMYLSGMCARTAYDRN